jgi:DNA-binding transcriptional LysR family regulator
MELGQLRALREVQARGSIAAAAQALHVTPSSVSQQLAALARKAGTPLTHKMGRRTALTPAGLALARAAVGVEVALERAETAVAQFRSDVAAPVHLAAFHSAGLALFGAVERQVMDDGGPPLRFHDQDVAQQDFPALTADYDLVIAHRLPNSPPWPSSVHVAPLAFEPLDVAVGATHPLARHRSLTPAGLRGERWVSVRAGFPLAGAIETIGTLAGEEAVITHRINEFFVAASVVEGGGCVALMPRYTVNRALFPRLLLKPLVLTRAGKARAAGQPDAPALGRHIDILARPEAMERVGVRQVVQALSSAMEDLVLAVDGARGHDGG